MLKKSLTILTAGAICVSSLFAGDKLDGAGATFPAPVYYDWAFNYEKETSNKINYQSIGSGSGIKQIGERVVNFGASDEPLKPTQLEEKKLLQFPAVIGSIVLAYNLEGVKDLKLKNSIVADIFAGKITKWNDEKIKADNPNVNLPDKEINTVHRSDGSGTTYNFTYFLSMVNDEWKNSIGTGKAVSWPNGLGGKGNEGVTNQIMQTPNSIGYIEYAYAQKNNLPTATIQTKSGKWVEAKEENFKAAAKYATWTKQDHFYEILALQNGDTSYPIVAATFILLPKEATDTNKKVTAFYNYAFEKGDASAVNLGYIPLPKETKDMIQSYWKDNSVSPK